jgi:hypothetical protein
MTLIDLDKVDSKFRLLTDLLLFSDRKDISLSEIKKLLKNNNAHYDYFWDRFIKATEISWSSDFWNDRINFILSINNKRLSKSVERHLEKRMFELVKFGGVKKIDSRMEYLQFLEYCKVKKKKKGSFSNIRKKFSELPLSTNFFKLAKLINYFIPCVFDCFEDYISLLRKESKIYNTHMGFIIFANQQNIINNKSSIVDIFFEIINCNFKLLKTTARKSICEIIKDEEIRNLIKQKYTSETRNYLVKFVLQMSHTQLDQNFFTNFKNLIALDNSLVDELLNIYANQLFLSESSHKRAKVDRLFKLIKFVPEITPKKVLTWLSLNNKNSDMKYFLSMFPDLKKIAAFA